MDGADWVSLLEDWKLERGQRVLVLSTRAALRSRPLEAEGFEPVVPTDPERLDYPAHHFDAAIVEGLLDRSEWDRWILQQVWRCLKEGAGLGLVAGNLWSLTSPWDAVRLAERTWRELARRMARASSPPTRAVSQPFRGHLYTPQRMQQLLTGLGFEVLACKAGDRGLLGPRFGTSWMVSARKRVAGVAGGSVPLPACAHHRVAYERAHKAYFEARSGWLARAGRAPMAAAKPLDLGAYANAQVLVLAPHPDDEVIGCGGTLLRLVKAGAGVTCVQATDGSDAWALRDAPESVRRTVRLDEARRVAAAAGFVRLEEWRADNRAFEASEELVTRMAALLEELQPRLVFSAFLADMHRDHLTLNRILSRAIRRAQAATRETLILGYEVWSKAPADAICDVTDVRAEQESLLWQYPTGMRTDDFIRLCEERNYYNACTYLDRAGYAEVFQVSQATEFPDLFEATTSG